MKATSPYCERTRLIIERGPMLIPNLGQLISPLASVNCFTIKLDRAKNDFAINSENFLVNFSTEDTYEHRHAIKFLPLPQSCRDHTIGLLWRAKDIRKSDSFCHRRFPDAI